MSDETAQQRWDRIRAEYAIARTEHRIAYEVLASRPRASDVRESASAESLAEQAARRRLLSLRDEMQRLGADLWVDSSGAVAD